MPLFVCRVRFLRARLGVHWCQKVGRCCLFARVNDVYLRPAFVVLRLPWTMVRESLTIYTTCGLMCLLTKSYKQEPGRVARLP